MASHKSILLIGFREDTLPFITKICCRRSRRTVYFSIFRKRNDLIEELVTMMVGFAHRLLASAIKLSISPRLRDTYRRSSRFTTDASTTPSRCIFSALRFSRPVDFTSPKIAPTPETFNFTRRAYFRYRRESKYTSPASFTFRFRAAANIRRFSHIARFSSYATNFSAPRLDGQTSLAGLGLIRNFTLSYTLVSRLLLFRLIRQRMGVVAGAPLYKRHASSMLKARPSIAVRIRLQFPSFTSFAAGLFASFFDARPPIDGQPEYLFRGCSSTISDRYMPRPYYRDASYIYAFSRMLLFLIMLLLLLHTPHNMI